MKPADVYASNLFEKKEPFSFTPEYVDVAAKTLVAEAKLGGKFQSDQFLSAVRQSIDKELSLFFRGVGVEWSAPRELEH